MQIFQRKSTVSVAKVVTLAVQRVLKEALPPALVLASQGIQVVHLIIRVRALEHVDPRLVGLRIHRAEGKVAVVLWIDDKLISLSLTVERLAMGQHQELSLAIPGATVEMVVRGTLVGENVGQRRGLRWAVVEQGAVPGIGKVSLGSTNNVR